MKPNIYLLRGSALAFCLAASLMVWSQAPKKPQIQTSASSKETVYKPLKDSDDKKTSPQQQEVVKVVKETKIVKQSAAIDNRYIALKTNVPFLAIAIQNLSVEVQLRKQISVELPVIWSISDLEREHAVRTITFQPEGRWWLKEAGTGHFFGVHVHVGWFNVKWNDDRYQTGKRPLLGAGISYGYKLPLSEHWGAEFTLGAGYANMKYDTYYNIENGAKIGDDTTNYWGITRVGASLVYRF